MVIQRTGFITLLQKFLLILHSQTSVTLICKAPRGKSYLLMESDSLFKLTSRNLLVLTCSPQIDEKMLC